MWCPKCRAEFREGFTKCNECEADLIYELPPEEKFEEPPEKEVTLVTIATYISPEEATLVAGILKENGIEAEIFKDDGGGTRPGLVFGTGVKLVVSEEDAFRAKELLESISNDDRKGTQ